MDDKDEVIQAGKITGGEIKVTDIEAGHISIGIWNGKIGADAKFGTKHLYSAGYRERWPQDQYPELYKEDEDIGEEKEND